MEKINITFLGTGTAVPTPTRNHTSILINIGTKNILVDCGEGTQTQFQKAKISPQNLTHLLITHWHGDHIFGLPGLFETLAMRDYNKTLLIYGPKGTKEKIKSLNKLNKIKIPIIIHEISSGKILESKDLEISCLPMKHTSPTLAYSISIPEKIRLDKLKISKMKIPHGPHFKNLQAGKSIKLKGKTILAKSITYKELEKKITIIMDTLPNDNAIKLAKSSDLLISESTFVESSNSGSKLAKEKLHLTAKQAATIAKKAKAKSLILTHISQRYDKNLDELEKEAKSIFKNTSIAKDLQKVSI